MNELKPCPFCGADNGYVDVISNPFSNDIYSRGHCVKCHAVGTFYVQSYLEGELRPSFEQMAQMATEQWNTRPIEDALRKRIAELESTQRWRVVADGELPDDDVEVFVLLYGSSVSTGKHYRNARHLDLEDNSYNLNYVIGDYWLIGEDETTCAQHYYNAVTHWMPLPECSNDTQTDSVVYGKDSKEESER